MKELYLNKDFINEKPESSLNQSENKKLKLILPLDFVSNSLFKLLQPLLLLAYL